MSGNTNIITANRGVLNCDTNVIEKEFHAFKCFNQKIKAL